MSEIQVSPVVKVARDLREIEKQHEALMVQAIHKAGARIDGTSLPGGDAMVALGNVGSPDEWSELVAAAEFRHLAECPRLDHTRCRYAEHVGDEDGAEPPLQTLLFWSEQWREEHGYPLEGRPTMTSEVRFLRWALDWAWDNLQEWDDFAKDVRDARVRLENLLYAGNRVDQTRVSCDREPCERKPNLIFLRGAAIDGSDDRWKCPACKTRFARGEFNDAFAKQLRHESAARYVSQGDAISTLRAIGRSENTVRSWLKPPRRHVEDRCSKCHKKWKPSTEEVCPNCGGDLVPFRRGNPDDVIEGYCDIATHQTLVWWPDIWRRHLRSNRPKSDGAVA